MGKIAIIIPAHNEEKTIGSVIGQALKYSPDIIVIDDGSSDNTDLVARQAGAKVYRHIINTGVGGALGTGFRAARQSEAEIVVMLDADGQHDPNDISRLIEPILKNSADVVIGSRFLSPQPMPILRRLYNKIANLITRFLFAVKTTDSQSGLRAFSKQALEMIDIRTTGPEVCSEIIKEIGQKKLRLAEISIKAIYTDYSLSKGQNFFLGIKTFLKLLMVKALK